MARRGNTLPVPEIRARLNNKGLDFLNTENRGVRKRHHISCQRCLYDWTPVLGRVLHLSNCPKCSKQAHTQKVTGVKTGKQTRERHRKRITAILAILKQNIPFGKACKQLAQQAGMSEQAYVQSWWKYATPQDEKQRERHDIAKRIQRIKIKLLVRFIQQGKATSYWDACEKVGLYLKITREKQAAKDYIHQTFQRAAKPEHWDIVYEKFPDTLKERPDKDETW